MDDDFLNPILGFSFTVFVLAIITALARGVLEQASVYEIFILIIVILSSVALVFFIFVLREKSGFEFFDESGYAFADENHFLYRVPAID